MNLKQIYEAVLIELEKQKAPSMLLDEFNYFVYKAIIQYVNTNYNFLDMNQQIDDNLRVLYSTASLSENTLTYLNAAKRIIKLPDDYFHLRNCIVKFSINNALCVKDQSFERGALRITSDKYPGILNNYYFKPSYKVPYYYIQDYEYSGDTTTIKGIPGVIQIICGNETGVVLEDVVVTYLKLPKKVEITSDNLDNMEAWVPEELEFPDYVCFEIINIMVKLFLERHHDPRLSSNPVINQTIAPPQLNV